MDHISTAFDAEDVHRLRTHAAGVLSAQPARVCRSAIPFNVGKAGPPAGDPYQSQNGRNRPPATCGSSHASGRLASPTSDGRGPVDPASVGNPTTWDDFQGIPPLNNPFDAETAVRANLHLEFAYYVDPSCDALFWTKAAAVTVELDRQGSWVRLPAKRNALLSHEIGHLDLMRIKARETERSLYELTGTSTQGTCAEKMQQAHEEWRAGARKIFDHQQAAYNAASSTYDHDTDHGRNQAEQKRWNALLEQWRHECGLN